MAREVERELNITDVEIQAGDHLAEIHSPDFLVGQQELLIALQSRQDGSLVQAAIFWATGRGSTS
jgi:hypothetical protein